MTMKKRRILLLVETSRSFGREIIQGITQYATEKGDWTLFLEDRGLVQKEALWTESFPCHGIISRTTNATLLRKLKQLDVPVVELHGDNSVTNCDIHVHPQKMGQMAASHFRGKGLKLFAFFSLGHSWWSNQFFEEFSRSLEAMGLACEPNPFCSMSNNAALNFSLTRNIEKKVVDWLHALPKPIGVFCPSDSLGLCMINLCQMAGIFVPHQVAVLGVENNVTLCSSTSPPLSSIAANGKTVGYKAAELLALKMKGRKIPPLPILIEPSLIVTRQSSDLIAVDDPDVGIAIRFIRDNVSSRIGVSHVVKHTGISQRTLFRRFNEYLGHSIEAEIVQTRMERAKTLLRETTMTLNAVAQSVGFMNSEYFIRAFRRECGMTPKQYRQSLSQSDS